MKKTLTYSLVLFSVAALSILIMVGNQQPQKPNMIIIITDDQGYGDVGFNGNQMIQTPVLDSLAKHNIIIDRFYSFPQNSYSYESLITGKYASTISEKPDGTPIPVLTLTEILENNQYQIGVFESGNPKIPANHQSANSCNEFHAAAKGASSQEITDSLMHFIRQSSSPFFALLAFHTSSALDSVPDEIAGKYRLMNLDEQTSRTYAFFETTDYHIGRIFESLENKGILENTIVVYLSSNGPDALRFNNGLKGRKGQLDEGSVRVPMILSYPNGKFKAQRIESFAGSMLDITPTLISLATITFDSTVFDGINLTRFLNNPQTKFPDRALFFHLLSTTKDDSCVAIRQNNFLLTYYQEDTALYNLNTDPYQRANIKTTNKIVFKTLLKTYEQWK
ncbi:MAG: sulfatase-like hydrolase/transferase [Salinivirgaceae bacterium]|nr:sulfatase-like hydrolase/transferase [Salinivirgaceae bacterium]